MKEYTAPQVTVIDNWEELNIAPATLEWEVDNEKNQIVVTSRYEQVAPEDEDDEMRYFKLREEPVEVLRIDCDPAEIEIVKEGVDDEGNKFKTIVTKSQMVAFEMGSYNGELKEYMAYDEDFSIYPSELEEGVIVFHKDGRWWFYDLCDNGLMTYEEYDDETGEERSVPFSCEAIHPLFTGRDYVRGRDYIFDQDDFYGTDIKVICEDGDRQYAIRLPYVQYGISLLNQNLWAEDGVQEPWTEIKLMPGDLTVRKVTDEEGVKIEGIYDSFFNGAKAYYNRENKDEPLQYNWISSGEESFLRVIQGNVMRLVPKEYKYRWSMNYEEAKGELLHDWQNNGYGVMGIEFKDRADEYFVVKKEVPVGSRKKVQYRIVFEDTYIEGTWDDVEIVSNGDAQKPLFKVKKDGYWGMIDNVGTVIVPLRFTGISAKGDGMTTVNNVTLDYVLTLNEFGKKGWGYLSLRTVGFVQTIPCEYECVEASGNGWVIDEICVEKMGRVATYDLNGRLKEEFKPGRI